MSRYDEYDELWELNPFYLAIEEVLAKKGIATGSEIIEKGSKPFPKLPREYDANEDYDIDLISEDQLPF